MKKVLILSNYGMGLYKFRRELISKLCSVYDVSICIPEGEYNQALRDLGANVINIDLNRRGMNPVQEVGLLRNYVRTIKSVHPNIVLTYTIKPNVYGGIACRITKTPYIPNITGLGTAVENGGLLGTISRTLYKTGLKKAKCVFFQNSSNRDLFVKKKIYCGSSRLIPGSGVNLQEHSYTDYPADSKGKTKLLFVGRIMRDKGINELLKTLDLLVKDNEQVFLDIVGEYDEDYSDVLEAYEKAGRIKYHGLQQDVKPFYRAAHCVVLPSYHEGMANVLLEAAATGRPVVASNIPGCKEAFIDGETGFGCNVKDADSLFLTLKKFLALPFEKRREMGIKGRKKMESEFDRNLIVQAYMEEIEEI